MKMHKSRDICLIMFLLVAALVFGQTAAAEDEHVPAGIAMQAGFKPGFGETLGLFKKTVGRVVLIHATDTSGYWAEVDLPLYMKDKIVTPEEGLALLQFLDDSTISVAEDSDLVINRFIFDPDKFDRSTFLSMQAGKARFWVKKLENYSRSEFKVKTNTMVAGVRGTDFVIEVLPGGQSQVYVLEGSIDIFPIEDQGKVITVRTGETAKVDRQNVSPVEKISPDEAARLKNELPMPYDSGVMEAAGAFGQESKGEEAKKGEVGEEKVEVVEKPVTEEIEPAGEAAPPAPQTAEMVKLAETTEKEVVEKVPEKTEKAPEGEEVVYAGGEILYPADDLVPPDPLIEIDTLAQEPVIDWFVESTTLAPASQPSIFDVADTSSPTSVSPSVFVPTLTTLPGMPGTP